MQPSGKKSDNSMHRSPNANVQYMALRNSSAERNSLQPSPNKYQSRYAEGGDNFPRIDRGSSSVSPNKIPNYHGLRSRSAEKNVRVETFQRNAG